MNIYGAHKRQLIWLNLSWLNLPQFKRPRLQARGTDKGHLVSLASDAAKLC